MNCHLILVVWGETFRQYLISVCLPSLLAAGNIPAWPHCATSRLRLFMPAEDWEAIQESPVIKQVQALLTVEWCPLNQANQPLPDEQHIQKYSYRGMVMSQALQAAMTEQAAIIILIPDMVYSAKFLTALANEIAKGKEALFHWGPRLTTAQLAALEPHATATTIHLPVDTAETMLIEGLHPDYQAYDWLHPMMNVGNPRTVLYWSDDHTYCCRTLMADPLFLATPRPFDQHQGDWGSLDDTYIGAYDDLVAHPEKVALVGQGDFMALSFTPVEQMPLSQNRYKPIPLVWRARAIYEHMRQQKLGALAYWFFQQELTFSKPTWVAPMPPNKLATYQPWLKSAPWLSGVLVAQIGLWFEQGKALDIRNCWEQPETQTLLYQLQDPVLYPVFYWIAWSFAMTADWLQTHRFIQKHHAYLIQAYYDLSHGNPTYLAYWPEPTFLPAETTPFDLVLTETLPNFSFPERNWVVVTEKPTPEAMTRSTLGTDILYHLVSNCEQLVVATALRLVHFEVLLYAILRGKPIQWLNPEEFPSAEKPVIM